MCNPVGRAEQSRGSPLGPLALWRSGGVAAVKVLFGLGLAGSSASAAPLPKTHQLFDASAPAASGASKITAAGSQPEARRSQVQGPARARRPSGQPAMKAQAPDCAPAGSSSAGTTVGAGALGKKDGAPVALGDAKNKQNCAPASESTAKAMAVTSGQPAAGSDGCTGPNDIVCARSNVTHMTAFRFAVTTSSEMLAITTAELAPLALPLHSSVCYGTPWHGTDGSCSLGSDCPGGECDAATGRCLCSGANKCCSGSCTGAGRCDLAQLTQMTTTPDTVLMLLRCTSSDCNTGEIVRVDDDGNAALGGTLSSRIDIPAPVPGTYLAVVKSYQGYGLPRDGRARLQVQANGTIVTDEQVVFGGRELPNRAVLAGDTLFAAKNNDGGGMTASEDSEFFEYHDTTLLVTENAPGSPGWQGANCQANCGRYAFNDDAYYGYASTLHSRVVIPEGWNTANAGVTVAVYDSNALPQATYVNARVLHHRKSILYGGGWQGTQHIDRDSDGLTEELELALGTCDDRTSATPIAVGIAGRSCSQYADLIDDQVNHLWVLNPTNACPASSGSTPWYCWSARDSDNDGLEDGWEVFAAPFHCSQPPTGALHTTGSCAPLSIHESNCPGSTCMVESLAARSDPDPTVYDIFGHNLSVRCGPEGLANKDAGCAAAHNYPVEGNDHDLTGAQKLRLHDIFARDAATCEDGNMTDADANLTCPHDAGGDLRYMMNVHTYSAGVFELPDDTPGAELLNGPAQTRAMLNSQFLGPMRHAALSRFAFVAHKGHGQSGKFSSGARAPWFVTNNNLQGLGFAISTWAHEAGHTLSLTHTQEDGGMTPVWGACAACTTKPMLCGATCARYRENPVIDSLMAYTFNARGMRDRGAGAPEVGDAAYQGCSWEQSHFSKGYNTGIDEGAVREMFTAATSEHWRNRSLVRTLACYRTWNTIALPEPPTAATCAAPLPWDRHQYAFQDDTNATPYCSDATQTCSVNWNGSTGAPEGGSYKWDVSFGSYATAVPYTCDADVLRDRNDFLNMMAVGKEALFTARLNGNHTKNASIYLGSFNRGNAVNNAGWPAAELPVSVAGTFDSTRYDVNSCATAADCPSGGPCLRDAPCQSDGECLKACNQVVGACSCASDSDCFSGYCDAANFLCVPSTVGRCACTADDQCSPTPNPSGGKKIDPVCKTGNTWSFCDNYSFSSVNQAALGMSDTPHKEALAFRGPSQTDELRLARNTVPNALELIALEGSWTLRFDVYLEPLPAGQAKATLFHASFGDISVFGDGNGGIAGVGFDPFPDSLGQGGGAPFDPLPVGSAGFGWATNRWYRILVVVDRRNPVHRYVTSLQPWNVFAGRYDPPVCGLKDISATEPPVAQYDVTFGWDGLDPATRVTARIDNVSLQSGVDFAGVEADTCAVLP